jgi:hypothetical protein
MLSDDSSVLDLSKKCVNIRMYDLDKGEGDCFLLRFLDDDGEPFHVLIDCGIFWRTEGEKARLNEIAEDIAAVTENHVNILIVTHEHWDHLAGFEDASDKFDTIEFDEVWLAWTENTPDDELAESLRKKYEDELQALVAVTEKFEAVNDPWIKPVKDVLSYSKGSNKLMNKVRNDLSSNPPRFCYPKDPPIILPGVSNFRFYVLGPPRDKSQLMKLNAEKAVHGEPMMIDDATSFTTAVFSSFGKKKLNSEERLKNQYLYDHSLPFDAKYGLVKKDALSLKVNDELFFETYYGPDDSEKSWRHIEDDWLYSAGNLALQLDDYTNNTSLVLAIEMVDTGKVLLFTGDAEAGNWESWKDLEWTIGFSEGNSVKRTGMDLVKQTAFYKVAHHGSKNGTLLDYLNQMRDDLVAMIPVNQTWAWEKKEWHHPDENLYNELVDKTSGRTIRADDRIPEDKPTKLSVNEWIAFKKNIYGGTKASNDLWVEYKFS